MTSRRTLYVVVHRGAVDPALMLRQLLLSALVLAGTLALWIAYVPSAMPALDRLDRLGLFGI